MNANTTVLLEKSVAKRAGLSQAHLDTNAYRLVHSEADHFPGMTVDKLGGTMLVELHKPNLKVEPLLDSLEAVFGKDTPIFVKERWSSKTGNCDGGQVRGRPAPVEISVRELGLAFALNLCDGEHIGLFLDSRPARKAVRGLAAGRRVLNMEMESSLLFHLAGALGHRAGTICPAISQPGNPDAIVDYGQAVETAIGIALAAMIDLRSPG